MSENFTLKSLEKTLTCKFHMELIFRFEYLDVEGAIWSKVLHGPGSQDGLMVLGGGETAEIMYFLSCIFKMNLL